MQIRLPEGGFDKFQTGDLAEGKYYTLSDYGWFINT